MANSDEEKKDQSETPEEDSEETAPEEKAADEESGAETSEAESAEAEASGASDDSEASDDDDSDASDSSDDSDDDSDASDSSDDSDEGSEDEDVDADDHEDEDADEDEEDDHDQVSDHDHEDEDAVEDVDEDDHEDEDVDEDDHEDEDAVEDDHEDDDEHEIAADDEDADESASDESRITSHDHDDDIVITERGLAPVDEYERSAPGTAAFFDHPDDLMDAARRTRDSNYEDFDAYSPFPIHGMDEAMGLGRSWMPWVTFAAGLTGFLTAVALEFGTMTFDWPLVIGGKPFAPWPSFVPVMFELTVLIGGVTTGVVMLKAAGCFEPADVIDPDITDDRFCLWISASDDHYDEQEAVEFARSLGPTEVRTYSEKADSDG